MSLDEIQLPFLRIRDLPEKFSVAVTGNTETDTKFRDGQTVLKVLLDNEGTFPIKGSPATNFLGMSNHALKSIRAMGHTHLDDLTGMIVSFKKANVGGFGNKTIEATKTESW